MKTRKILFATDFSPLSAAAIETATALARDRGAKLLIAHAEEPDDVEGFAGISMLGRQERLRRLQAVLPHDRAVEYEHRLIAGDPAEAIVELADMEDVEMIVLATHGRTGLARMLMGSVAEVIVRKAHCPVLTMKSPLPEPVLG